MARIYAADVSALIEDEKLMDAAINMVSEERAEKVKRFASIESKALSAGAELLLRAAIADVERAEKEAARMSAVSADTKGATEKADARMLADSADIKEAAEKADVASLEYICKNRPIQFEYGQNGKPYLKGQKDLFFNLSHSGRWVVCALSHHEVGCDIERAEPRKSTKKIAARFFTDEERSFIDSCADKDPDGGLSAFYRLWTLKESFLKVTGYGLALPLKDFCIIISTESISVKQDLDLNTDYRFREFFDLSGYCCSVCSEGCEICSQITEVSLSDHILSSLKVE